jgi:hypothetical protein
LNTYSSSDAATAVAVPAWAVETFDASFAIITSCHKAGMVVVDPASKISQGVRISRECGAQQLSNTAIRLRASWKEES